MSTSLTVIGEQMCTLAAATRGRALAPPVRVRAPHPRRPPGGAAHSPGAPASGRSRPGGGHGPLRVDQRPPGDQRDPGDPAARGARLRRRGEGRAEVAPHRGPSCWAGPHPRPWSCRPRPAAPAAQWTAEPGRGRAEVSARRSPGRHSSALWRASAPPERRPHPPAGPVMICSGLSRGPSPERISEGGSRVQPLGVFCLLCNYFRKWAWGFVFCSMKSRSEPSPWNVSLNLKRRARIG